MKRGAKAIDLTQSQMQFIIDNYEYMKRDELVLNTGGSRYRVVKFMTENNLKRGSGNHPKPRPQDDYKKPNWVRDPWNHGLNTHTLLKTPVDPASKAISYNYKLY